MKNPVFNFMKKIKFVGYDQFYREVFVTEKGSYVVNLGDHANMRLYAKSNNDFEGEPDFPVKTENFQVVEEF